MIGHNMYLFDTNALVYYFAGEAVRVKELFKTLKEQGRRPHISVITKIEQLSISDGTEMERRALLGAIVVYGLTDDIVEEAARIRREYRLKLPDAIIAATALVYSLSIVTKNHEDFKKVKGLVLIDPIV